MARIRRRGHNPVLRPSSARDRHDQVQPAENHRRQHGLALLQRAQTRAEGVNVRQYPASGGEGRAREDRRTLGNGIPKTVRRADHYRFGRPDQRTPYQAGWLRVFARIASAFPSGTRYLARQNPTVADEAKQSDRHSKVLLRLAVRLSVRWRRGAEHTKHHEFNFQALRRNSADEDAGGSGGVVEGFSYRAGAAP